MKITETKANTTDVRVLNDYVYTNYREEMPIAMSRIFEKNSALDLIPEVHRLQIKNKVALEANI